MNRALHEASGLLFLSQAHAFKEAIKNKSSDKEINL